MEQVYTQGTTTLRSHTAKPLPQYFLSIFNGRSITGICSEMDLTAKKIRKEKPDVQQLVLTIEDVLEEQRPDVDQQDPEPVHIKEEEEDDWSSLEAEHLNSTIPTEVNGFGFTSNPLKSEDDEDKPFPQLYVCQVEDGELLTRTSADPMKASTGGENCAEIEITWNPDDTDSCSSETSISEVDDEDEDEEADAQLSISSDSGSTSAGSDSGWMESRASASGVNTIINSVTFSDHREQFGTNQSPQRDVTGRSGRTSSTCFVIEEDVSRKTAKRPWCRKLKRKVPNFMGDHNYA
ncbi:uncharacterized protein LOC106521647 isoform X3 [Austrofundulus limnaeus]|uniref:Uncharacterized protein LOC106521647 isoform X3 n=1 Tax=Austrofundulus limnaeus TaxID=52670 RepID=A0AC58RKA0_AUSLI